MSVLQRQPARPYRSHRRQEQAQATRQRVLGAAREVFLESGYAGATVRGIATRAGVSVPTVETSFGTKARILKAAIDVAIAGDDEPVGVLARDWAAAGRHAESATEVLAIAAAVIAPAQSRSAGLVLAVFEGSRTDPELARLAQELIDQRARTAAWLVDTIAAKAACTGLDRAAAVDTVWLLMDPAVFDRATRQRHWEVRDYELWFARSVARLLLDHPLDQPSQHRSLP